MNAGLVGDDDHGDVWMERIERRGGASRLREQVAGVEDDDVHRVPGDRLDDVRSRAQPLDVEAASCEEKAGDPAKTRVPPSDEHP